jgi:hypothetical protein
MHIIDGNYANSSQQLKIQKNISKHRLKANDNLEQNNQINKPSKNIIINH